jgi:hypothetical protein
MLLAAQSPPVGGVVMTIAVLVISVALVAGLAWAARRLLGRPVGTLRALAAGLLGFAAAELFGRWLLPAQTGHVAAFFTVARRLDRISGSLEQGRLGVNVRLFADERDRRVVTGLTNQFLLTFLGAATGIMAALLLGVTAGSQIASDVSLAQLIGYNLLLVASILVLRVLFTIFRNR